MEWVDPLGLISLKEADQKVKDIVKAASRKHATYIGGVKNEEFTLGKSGIVGCAVDHIKEQLGDGFEFTKAYGKRRNKITSLLEVVEIPTCTKCQKNHDRNKFPSDVKFAPGGSWSKDD